MHESVQEAICSLLEVPSIIGRGRKKALEFVKNRVWNKLANWDIRKLSRTDKEVMLKTVAQALPNYTMSGFLLPRGLCPDME